MTSVIQLLVEVVLVVVAAGMIVMGVTIYNRTIATSGKVLSVVLICAGCGLVVGSIGMLIT